MEQQVKEAIRRLIRIPLELQDRYARDLKTVLNFVKDLGKESLPPSYGEQQAAKLVTARGRYLEFNHECAPQENPFTVGLDITWSEEEVANIAASLRKAVAGALDDAYAAGKQEAAGLIDDDLQTITVYPGGIRQSYSGYIAVYDEHEFPGDTADEAIGRAVRELVLTSALPVTVELKAGN